MGVTPPVLGVRVKEHRDREGPQREPQSDEKTEEMLLGTGATSCYQGCHPRVSITNSGILFPFIPEPCTPSLSTEAVYPQRGYSSKVSCFAEVCPTEGSRL